MEDKRFSFDLNALEFNGVIHVGAGTGEYARYYHEIGIHQVAWIDKNQNLYGQIYNNTKNFGMKQLYFTHKLSNKNIIGPDCSFKNFWRQHRVDIDIETYDLLHISVNDNVLDILKGFEDFLSFFRAIVFSKTNGQGEISEFLDNNFYIAEFNNEQALYLRR